MVQAKQHDVIQQAAVQFDVQHTVHADQIVGGSQCLTAGILHRRSLSPQVVDYEHVVAAAALVHLKALSLIQQVKNAADAAADADTCYVIRNGRAEMGSITGTGCQLSGMMTAYLVANPDEPLKAAAAAVCAMGLAGEIGWSHMKPEDGNSTYRNRIIDAIYHMDGETLEKGAKYEVR